jgi:hypothetical protein
MGCTQVSALDVAIDGADSVDLSMVRRHVITHSRTQICASQLRRAQLGFCCAPSPGCLDAHTHTHCLAFVFHPAFGGVEQLWAWRAGLTMALPLTVATILCRTW